MTKIQITPASSLSDVLAWKQAQREKYQSQPLTPEIAAHVIRNEPMTLSLWRSDAGLPPEVRPLWHTVRCGYRRCSAPPDEFRVLLEGGSGYLLRGNLAWIWSPVETFRDRLLLCAPGGVFKYRNMKFVRMPDDETQGRLDGKVWAVVTGIAPLPTEVET